VNVPPRELVASINGAEVGVLRDEGNIWSFEYHPEWRIAKEAFDLAPNLPRTTGRILDGATTRPVQWFFDNLLPEESARDVLANEANIESSDAFGLLAYYGRESAGAVTLQPPGDPVPGTGYLPLTDQELHDRIAQLPRHSLSAGAPKRMSNAGAQHKLAICIRDEQLFHPVGDTPSTHILKPDHIDKDTWPNSVANEYFVMRLGARLGLEVPQVQVRYVPDPVYLVERFDRETVAEGIRRLHIIDACQLLGLDRTFKYQQASSETFVRCIELCENRARSRQSILAWTLFNLLTGNADAHLKNVSFRVSSRGIGLAPFYDLVSTECYRAEYGNQPRWPNRPLSMQIGAATTFAEVTRANFKRFADELGVTASATSRLVDQFIATIDGAADELYRALEEIKIPQPIVREGQLRVVRSIRYAVIRDMLARFSAGKRCSSKKRLTVS
jgi:serine/threonine-protein kinase HipA